MNHHDVTRSQSTYVLHIPQSVSGGGALIACNRAVILLNVCVGQCIVEVCSWYHFRSKDEDAHLAARVLLLL